MTSLIVDCDYGPDVFLCKDRMYMEIHALLQGCVGGPCMYARTEPQLSRCRSVLLVAIYVLAAEYTIYIVATSISRYI